MSKRKTDTPDELKARIRDKMQDAAAKRLAMVDKMRASIDAKTTTPTETPKAKRSATTETATETPKAKRTRSASAVATVSDDLSSIPADAGARKEAEEDLKFRRLRANVILLEAKARREQVNADSDAISLEKSRGNLCYNDVALAEFSRVVKLMYDDFKRLPQVVTERAALNPEQAAVIRDEVESILRELSAVEVDLTISNTAEVDAKVKSANLHRAKGEARSRLT